MQRGLIFVLGMSLLSSACLRVPTNRSADESQSSSKGSDSALAVAAGKVTDACTVMPADLVQKIVPGGGAPQSEQYPRRCSVSNGKSVLEITIETGLITPTDPVKGAEYIPGLALGGYLERLDPVSRGDTYLTVILGRDPNGLLHVEIAGHDGKDHKEDAIAVAQAVLAQLR